MDQTPTPSLPAHQAQPPRAALPRPRQPLILNLVQRALFLFIAFEIINFVGFPAYLGTLDLLKLKAQADNADATERAKAADLAAQAKSELAAAQNAKIIAKAEAETAESNAAAARAKAITTRQEANNASEMQKSTADDLAAKAVATEAQAQSVRAQAAYAIESQKALADKAIADLANNYSITIDCFMRFDEIRQCPGSDPFEKIAAKAQRRC